MKRLIKFGLVGILSCVSLIGFGYGQMTSMECQTEYNLIPIENIDTNYAVQNNLCPLESTGVEWSALYVNDIQHISAPEINIVIPDEIAWEYTGDENLFSLFISGYNVDTDYIESLINAQNYKPNSQDFNNVITGLVPLIIPGLVIILFIRFIFKFIKKIF